MRLPRVRFSVRSLMLVVAAVGMVSAITVFKRRHDNYRAQTQRFTKLEGNSREMQFQTRQMVEIYEKALEFWSRDGRLDKMEEVTRRVALQRKLLVLEVALRQHYGELRKKYERAAARPWLPVEPDPSSQITELLAKMSRVIEDQTVALSRDR